MAELLESLKMNHSLEMFSLESGFVSEGSAIWLRPKGMIEFNEFHML